MLAQNNRGLLAVAPLFLVLLIDSMGLGLLFPILNSVLVAHTSHFLPAGMSNMLRTFLYGFVMSIFMLSWFFGSAILGDLSDNVGRKRALTICLLGAFVGYGFSAIAMPLHSVVLLVIGRVVAGFTAGSQPIAQAAIVDVSPPEHKTRNIGMILLAVSVGFVLGPIAAGVLSDSTLVSWFDFSTPFYFAALISLLNAILLWVTFTETFEPVARKKITLYRAFSIFVSAFKHEKIRGLSVVLLVMMFGWSNYFTFSSLFMLQRYQATTFEVSMFLAVMGVGFSIGCGFLVDFCAKRYQPQQSVVFSLLVATVFIALTAATHEEIYAWISVLINGVFIAIAYSTLIAMFSDQVGPNEQGWVMGVTGSISALCFGVTTLLTGLVAHWGPGLPMWFGALGMFLSALSLRFLPGFRAP